ncbi:hypothetical protein PIB30_013486 [Stylosanthes scabra]|uniref:TIR domain-containing protein n=1 Tax=Stylosanthes scabra TaxID=79078 RepID=A0ABU6Z5H6_9FABA|nr:hypothetical protein [Stylosanthes scabra]
MLSSSTTEYDVFISFRGEDTRKTFTGRLFNALKDRAIRVYMDRLLKGGDEIWPTLEKAIENSLMSIVVFSENFATSKWCLEELVKIVQWRDHHGQVVIPVFYRTEPRDVRSQRGSYEKAFAKYEREEKESNREKISKWRQALKEAANISGWHSTHYEDDDELARKVVKDVLEMRILKHPNIPTGLVGIKQIRKSIKFKMKQHGVIGIWGMPGIGKTTIAKMLFAKSFPHYDYVCYAENAKEYTPQRLLSELLREQISTDEAGFVNTLSRLSNRKVLIVLDNVKEYDQTLLEAVCEGYKSHSRDSKLIITTTDKDLLEKRVEWTFEVKQWTDSKSIELLSLKAFEERIPPKPFENLVNMVVKYAGGIPLALNVLGSYLRHKSIQFWENTLKKLQKHLHQGIDIAFRKIYDELDKPDKEIFLDIAFFFHGEKKDLVSSILEACNFSAINGIEVLHDKAMITTIPFKETIDMHGLLRELAYKVVHEENSKDPRKRSRLRDTQDICDVLKENKKSLDAIEGIILDLSQIKNMHLSPDAFKRMNKLRFLKFYIPSNQISGKMVLPKDLEPFSDKLRYFEWHQYPFVSLPPSFCAKLLVEIRMPHSHVKRLWEEKQELEHLEGIDLSECKELEELPDLSEAKRLKWVNLTGCETLTILPSSVFSSNTLVSLILDRCTNLQCVKAKGHLNSLQYISVKGCSNLTEFAVSSDLIKNLDLSYTKIEELDKSIGKLQKLESLNLEGSRVKHLPKVLSALKLLKELKHSYNGLEIDKQQLQDLFNSLHSLQILHLKDCKNSFEFPDNIIALSKLRELRLDGSYVTRLPATIKGLQELEILSLDNCIYLETLPEPPSSIKEFSVVNCSSLSVAHLNTLATKMVGKTKRISFNNSLTLSSGDILHSIMESIHSTMMSAVSNNATVRSYGTDVHSYNYNSVEVSLPGDTIPEQFAYKTEKSSSITIELPDSLSNSIGFIYSVVLSPRHGTKKHRAKIRCQYSFAGGTNSSWEDITISELNSDHLFIWYDPFHTDKILGQDKPSFHLEFSVVATDTGEVDDSIIVKECGVQIINESEWQIFSQEFDKMKKDIEEESSTQQLHPSHGSQDHSHVQTPPHDLKKERIDKQNNDTENQISKRQTEMNEQSSVDLQIEEKMESAPNENKTSGGKSHKENKPIKGKGNEEPPTESDVGLPLSIDSVKNNASVDMSKENYHDQPNAMGEVKHLEEKQEVHHSIHDMTADEPHIAKRKEAMDLKTSEGQEHTSNADQTGNLGQQNVDAKKLQELHKAKTTLLSQPINSSSIPSHGSGS